MDYGTKSSDVINTIQTLIDKGATGEDIEKLAIKEGMQTMIEDGLSKVVRGITTVEELLRVLHE